MPTIMVPTMFMKQARVWVPITTWRNDSSGSVWRAGPSLDDHRALPARHRCRAPLTPHTRRKKMRVANCMVRPPRRVDWVRASCLPTTASIWTD
jgi:hypothetical protein